MTPRAQTTDASRGERIEVRLFVAWKKIDLSAGRVNVSRNATSSPPRQRQRCKSEGVTAPRVPAHERFRGCSRAHA
jgi:hypothetical protein